MKIKVGQVGIGTWGQNHCQLLAGMPDVELVGLHDINFKRCGATAQDFGTKEFQELLLLIEKVDALVITAPTHQHFDIAHRALENQRHVFVEKPICAQVEHAKTLVELAKKHDLILQVGHIERFNPAFRALNGIPLVPGYLDARRLSPYSPRGNDVSVILDLMIHDLDIIQALVKSAPASVQATGFSVMSPTTDFANARIRFANGTVTNVTASRISDRKFRKITMVEEGRQWEIDFLTRETRQFLGDGNLARSFLSNTGNLPNNPLLDELQSFFDCVRNCTKPEVDGVEGLKALELAEVIADSIDREKNE